jgi:hypothetical protein
MLNMDKLYESVAAKGHVCVGLDTAPVSPMLKAEKFMSSSNLRI